MKLHKILVRVVLLRGEKAWVAQCLEHDIAAQGDSIPAVLRAFERIFLSQIVLDLHRGSQPFEDFDQAPQEYWQHWKEGVEVKEDKGLYVPGEALPAEVPPAFMIPAIISDVRVFG